MTNSFPRSIEFKITQCDLEWPAKPGDQGIIRVTVIGGGIEDSHRFEMPLSLQQAVEEILRAKLSNDERVAAQRQPEETRTGSVPTGERHVRPGGQSDGG